MRRQPRDFEVSVSRQLARQLYRRAKKELSDSVEISKKTRIYVIWRNDETEKMKGRFISGARKAPLWTGYAVGKEQLEDEAV